MDDKQIYICFLIVIATGYKRWRNKVRKEELEILEYGGCFRVGLEPLTTNLDTHLFPNFWVNITIKGAYHKCKSPSQEFNI